MRCRSGYRQLVATRSLSNHSRHLSVTPALLRSRLISVFFSRLYTVVQKVGPQTHDHSSVKSEPFKKILWKIPW